MLMESWSYVPQEKGFLSDETISPPSTLARSKSAFCNDMLLPTQQNLENQGFRELSFPEMVGKQLTTNHPASDAWNKQLGDAHGGRVINSVMAAPNGFPNGEDSNSKRSNSVVESNGRDSFIDLKLGRFGDQRDSKDLKFSEVAPVSVLSSSSSSTPPKRARASGGHSQTAFCQVYGCNKDLSGSKDYHKRHKVCELHSKTAKVIVNGIDQRFCQQCSRFHLLAEFDDGKRSCRKRLAGHNERRRKPQVHVHSGRSGRLLQSYTDNRFQGTSLATASFICQDILPSRLLHSEKLAADDWFRPVKTEDGANYTNLSAIPVSSGQPNLRCLVPSFNSEKPFSFLQENDASTTAGNIFAASNCQYTASLGVPNSGPRPLFHSTSLESEDFNIFDTTSNVQGFSGILDSGCALSLLSSQSQNSSAHSAGVLMPSSFVMQSSQSHYGMSQVSEKVTGMSSQNSANGVLNKFPSTEMIPGDGHLGVVMISDCSDVVNFNISDEILQETDFSNAKDHLTRRDGPTVDLLQLSSQLQRVEHRRQTVHVKPENLQHKYQLNGSSEAR